MKVKAITPVQRTAAQLLARGLTVEAVAGVVNVSTRTIRNWKHIPEFQRTLTETAAATRDATDPRGVLIDALTARKDDGIDWTNRVKAALALEELDARESTPGARTQLPRKVTIRVEGAKPDVPGVVIDASRR